MARQQSESVLLYSGVTAPTITQQEVSNISANAWYKGDLVHISATGYATIATGAYILGIATSAATGTDYADFDVEIVDFNALYTMTEVGSTATARANIGAPWDITFTVGAHTITTDSTSHIYVVGIYEGNDDVTAGGRYIFKFNQVVIEPGVG